jgi:ADP-L-glycero-D-manno-heptose 6-epimerase
MIVVTGGAGFIGSNIVAALSSDLGRKVTVCDSIGDDDRRRNLEKHKVAEVIAPGDLLGYLADNQKEIEAIIHMGAISATTETNAALIMQNNFRFSLDLWQWCTTNAVRFIYASSAATYGDGAGGFDDSNDANDLARLQPLNLYGWSKHLFDRAAIRLNADPATRPPQWAGLRFFNVFGPNEYHKGRMRSVALQVFERAKANEPMRLFRSHHPNYSDGGQLRDFIYVADCVDVVLWLLENPHVSGLFNLGTGKARSFADLAVAVYTALGQPVNIEYVDTPIDIRDKYQYFTEARMENLRARGYDKAFTSLEDGAAAYVKGFLETDDRNR